MTSLPNLDQMTPDQLRTLAAQLMSKVDTMGIKIHRDQTIIEQLTHEIAILKRHRFAKGSEQISPEQGSLLDDLLNTDLEAIDAELKALRPAPAPEEASQKPKRAPLPPQFPRTVIHHEPENTQCACGCQLQRIGGLAKSWEECQRIIAQDPLSQFGAQQRCAVDRRGPLQHRWLRCEWPVTSVQYLLRICHL